MWYNGTTNVDTIVISWGCTGLFWMEKRDNAGFSDLPRHRMQRRQGQAGGEDEAAGSCGAILSFRGQVCRNWSTVHHLHAIDPTLSGKYSNNAKYPLISPGAVSYPDRTAPQPEHHVFRQDGETSRTKAPILHSKPRTRTCFIARRVFGTVVVRRGTRLPDGCKHLKIHD